MPALLTRRRLLAAGFLLASLKLSTQTFAIIDGVLVSMVLSLVITPVIFFKPRRGRVTV